MHIEILWFLLSSVQYLVVSRNQSSRKPNKIIFVWVIFSHGSDPHHTYSPRWPGLGWYHSSKCHVHFHKGAYSENSGTPSYIHNGCIFIWSSGGHKCLDDWGPINAILLISHCVNVLKRWYCQKKGSSISNFLLVLFWFCCFFSNISRWNSSQLQQWRRCQLKHLSHKQTLRFFQSLHFTIYKTGTEKALLFLTKPSLDQVLLKLYMSTSQLHHIFSNNKVEAENIIHTMSPRLDDGIVVLILNTKEFISNYRIGQDDIGQKQAALFSYWSEYPYFHIWTISL